MTDRDDDVAKRFRTMIDQRHFVDHETGVLLIWVPVEREGLAELISQVEARHPGARYWHANGGVTYQDPDGREVVFVSWVYGRDRT